MADPMYGNSAARELKEILERREKEVSVQKTTEIKLDTSNIASFPDFPYTMESLGERVLVAIDIFRSGFECKVCQGKKVTTVKVGRGEVEQPCEACKGKGAILFIPDSGKDLPTTGVIVSVGDDVKDKKRLKIGARILFSPYSGTFIPTRAGVMLKALDEVQALLLIRGGENLGAFDFITEDL